MLENESKLNGSLDGAMKFVKGDAIAGIIIIIINLLGGLTIGVLQQDMTFERCHRQIFHSHHWRRHGVADSSFIGRHVCRSAGYAHDG